MVTVSVRIVADCGVFPCQVIQKLKRAATFIFTTFPAIIFTHCYGLGFIFLSNLSNYYPIIIQFIFY